MDEIDEREYDLLLSLASAVVTWREFGDRAKSVLLNRLASWETYRREREEEEDALAEAAEAAGERSEG